MTRPTVGARGEVFHESECVKACAYQAHVRVRRSELCPFCVPVILAIQVTRRNWSTAADPRGRDDREDYAYPREQSKPLLAP
jgi:hypothetical protein